MTEKIISRGESPPVETLWVERRLRRGRSVVRGKRAQTIRPLEQLVTVCYVAGKPDPRLK